MWLQILKIPYRILFPLILLFCLIGVYGLNSSSFDVLLMLIFGIVGYLFRKFDYEGAPLILAFILGPMLELNFRQSLILSKGNLLIFFTRPISAVFTIIAIIFFIIPIIAYFLKARSPKKK
jgi:putative tricarboxylic transport membrane protein